jgi:Domain of unknown function (DUF4124)
MMKIMRALIVFTAAAAVLLAAPARADAIYKWMDDQGVVHYSNSRPADPSRKAEVLAEDRISTYQSEAAVTRRAASRSETDYLARRVDLLERELFAQRQAAQSAAAAEARAMQAAYEQCLADRRVDCASDGGYGVPYVVYAGPFVPLRRIAVRSPRFHPVSSITGLTAGNVVTFRTAPARTGRTLR